MFFELHIFKCCQLQPTARPKMFKYFTDSVLQVNLITACLLSACWWSCFKTGAGPKKNKDVGLKKNRKRKQRFWGEDANVFNTGCTKQKRGLVSWHVVCRPNFPTDRHACTNEHTHLSPLFLFSQTAKLNRNTRKLTQCLPSVICPQMKSVTFSMNTG